MSDLLYLQNKFTNVLEWQEAGYTGRGIHILDTEGLSDHGKKTRQRVLDAAPDAVIFNKPWNRTTKSGQLTSEHIYDSDLKLNVPLSEFVEKYSIKIFTSSQGGKASSHKIIRPYLDNIQKKYNLVMFNSAGNDGSDGVKGGMLPQENAMYIGAVMIFNDDPNDIRACGYSSLGDEFEEVDFSTFTGKSGWNGTSFAAPFVAGQAALLLQRYGDMSQQEVYNYLKMCSKPLQIGHDALRVDFVGGHYIYDYRTGYGVPILPHLEKNYVTMDIGSRIFHLNGKPQKMDTEPFIKNGRTFVPIAFLALALDAKVHWNSLLKKVTITKNSRTVVLTIDKLQYSIDGRTYDMDVAPFIKDQRTFVPVSWIALALGCRVAWCADERRVQILETEA